MNTISIKEIASCPDCSERRGVCAFHQGKFGVDHEGRSECTCSGNGTGMDHMVAYGRHSDDCPALKRITVSELKELLRVDLPHGIDPDARYIVTVPSELCNHPEFLDQVQRTLSTAAIRAVIVPDTFKFYKIE